MEQEMPFGRMIKEINGYFEKKVNNDLQKDDITVAQFNMLLVLHLSEQKSVTMKEMEKLLHQAQSTVAGIAARLEKKNLIRTYHDKNDRRVKHLQITEEGRKICFLARQTADAEGKKVLAVLSAEEQEQLMKLLFKVYQTIE